MNIKICTNLELAMIDTGCSNNIMPYEPCKRLRKEDDLEVCNKQLITATGTHIKIHGILRNIDIYIPNLHDKIDLIVSDISDR